MATKRRKYKGWLIQWSDEEQLWILFTPEAMEKPMGCRYPETMLSTIADAKLFIDKYSKIWQ